MKKYVTPLKLPIGSTREYKSRLNRETSPFRMMFIPVISVLIGSMITTLPFLFQQNMLPPFGLLIFLGWRFLRRDLWPIWVGLPFGLFDDIFSGAPFGSAGLLWSLIMLALQMIDTRMPWRDHLQDWLIASAIIIVTAIAGLIIVGLAVNSPEFIILLPQIIISIAIFPMVLRLCARLDIMRLAT